MTNKLIDVDNNEWAKFGKICVLKEITMKEQIALFVEQYNQKHGGLLK